MAESGAVPKSAEIVCGDEGGVNSALRALTQRRLPLSASWTAQNPTPALVKPGRY
jgi:hypothetical protein